MTACIVGWRHTPFGRHEGQDVEAHVMMPRWGVLGSGEGADVRVRGPGVDAQHARLVVLWGMNPSATGIHLVPIVQEAQRLTRLIENVLQFSRAERGSSFVSINPARIDLLLHEILESFEPLARSKLSYTPPSQPAR